ncbi:hypothetical protein K7432_006252 [Basidiobolus ranarum]|uniref:Uncharacterized protein n=1 Tax=Basidiobolus ranarum TaxID=34480 RepID=A0ABR2WVG6_9FUNG
MDTTIHGTPHPDLHWIPAAGGEIPESAIQGGRENDGKPLYIARTNYRGGVHLGKTAPHLKGIAIGYDGKEISLPTYEVLCGDAMKVRWLKGEGGRIPQGWLILEGGRESDGKELFIAKTEFNSGEHIGKVGFHLAKGMCFTFDGKEKTTENYYILVHNDAPSL